MTVKQWKNCPRVAERDRLITQMGFPSYEAYLESDLWLSIRAQLCTDNRTRAKACICCESTLSLAWHHNDYSLPILVGNFSNTYAEVVRVCGECHRAIHTNGRTWFDMDTVADRLAALMSRYVEQGSVGPRINLPGDDTESFSDSGEF